MKTPEAIALSVVVVAVVVFAIWGAREVVKNNARDFNGGVDQTVTKQEQTEFSLNDIANALK